MANTDRQPCDCTHAQDLHDDGTYECEVAGCDCLAYVPLDNRGGVNIEVDPDGPIDEDEDDMEPYEQDPDWWKRP